MFNYFVLDRDERHENSGEGIKKQICFCHKYSVCTYVNECTSSISAKNYAMFELKVVWGLLLNSMADEELLSI